MDTEPMSPRSPSKRRRGAQPGNINALKHGLTARKYRPGQESVLRPIKPVFAPLTDDEETCLLRALFACQARLYSDVNDFIRAFPVFRRVVNILFLQASGIRGMRPLSAEDYTAMTSSLEQLMRLIMND
jgi:hypothetical protein